ncbi:MAG: glycosyltransferase [candidate division Zixibacteria bacterium]
MRVALVHDWLNGMRGGENVLQAFSSIFPRSVIYTLFCDPEMISADLKKHDIKTSFIQNFPLRQKHYRHFLPLFPRAIESFEFKNTDLVISSSHCVAKGAVTGKNTLHICYCHSPMRYVWDRFDDYFPKSEINPVRYKAIKYLTNRLRRWDKQTSGRVDLYLANSNFVKDRIKNYYNRPAKVIHPPVDTNFYTPESSKEESYFLLAGAMVPYKKGEIVIEAFRGVGEKLIVTGDGPELPRLANMASKNVEFTGWIDRETLRKYYQGCRALIFPGVEDFGIIPVEAQACGKPVIAYGKGGILDTVKAPDLENAGQFDGFKSGLFFNKQTPEEIRRAVKVFSSMEFDHEAIRNHTVGFSNERFYKEMNVFLNESVGIFRKQGKVKLEERLIN